MRIAQMIRPTVGASLVVAAAVLATHAAGAEPTIHEFAKSAVERKTFHKTEMAGFGIVHSEYRDLPRDGSILIGFDLAIRVSNDNSEIVALRPRYRTPRGDVVGQSAGSLSSSRDHRISKTERVD